MLSEVCPTHGTERKWPANCPDCDRERAQAAKDRRAERSSALLSLGFSDPFSLGGMFGVEFVSCLTCGAAVALTPVIEGQTHPLDLHRAWHDIP